MKLKWFKHFAVSVVVVSGLLSLTGCGPVYKTTYSYIPPKRAAGKVCVNQCQQNQLMCERLCQSERNACMQRARHDARPAYRRYVRERRHARLPVYKTIDNFVNPLACQSATRCNCDEPYHSCYQACGGEVIAHRVCVAFCDKR
jgi:hypothetical protein